MVSELMTNIENLNHEYDEAYRSMSARYIPDSIIITLKDELESLGHDFPSNYDLVKFINDNVVKGDNRYEYKVILDGKEIASWDWDVIIDNRNKYLDSIDYFPERDESDDYIELNDTDSSITKEDLHSVIKDLTDNEIDSSVKFEFVDDREHYVTEEDILNIFKDVFKNVK